MDDLISKKEVLGYLRKQISILTKHNVNTNGEDKITKGKLAATKNMMDFILLLPDVRDEVEYK